MTDKPTVHKPKTLYQKGSEANWNIVVNRQVRGIAEKIRNKSHATVFNRNLTVNNIVTQY